MSLFSPKFLLSIAGIVVLFILISLAQEMNRRLQVHREVARLESEAHKLEKSIIEMESLNQYFRTDAFQELMAREKLNYRAPGEQVVLLPEIDENREIPNNNKKGARAVAIPRRWWDAFFGLK